MGIYGVPTLFQSQKVILYSAFGIHDGYSVIQKTYYYYYAPHPN